MDKSVDNSVDKMWISGDNFSEKGKNQQNHRFGLVIAISWYYQPTVKGVEQSHLHLQNKILGQAGHSCYTQAIVATHFYITANHLTHTETEEFPMTTTTNHETFNESFVYYASFARMIARIPDRDLRL